MIQTCSSGVWGILPMATIALAAIVLAGINLCFSGAREANGVNAPRTSHSERLSLATRLVSIHRSAPTRPAELVVYPGPSGIQPSDQYAVTVSQNGKMLESFAYIVYAQWRTNKSKTTSWTTFSFSGKVKVKVTKLQGTFSNCRILPSSYGIQPSIHGNSVIFELDRPRKIALDFDNDITHPMLVFADPLEENIPGQQDPNVIYFGPGVHDIGADFEIKADQTVYLAGGAYVKGSFISHEASNIVIRGRGILSGEDFGKGGDHLIDLGGHGTRNKLIEGITLVNSPHYNIWTRGSGNVIRNVKMIGWYFSTDGVAAGRDSLVEDCFFKVNDDALKLYWSNMVVRDCVIWQMENGAPFQISWNMPGENSGFHVHNIDVIRVEHEWDNDNEAVFNAIHGGTGHMSDYLFEDIRIENADWCLLKLMMKKTEFAPPEGYGQISKLVFRNITVEGSMRQPNIIKGHSPEHQIYDVTFENVKVNGKFITSPEDGNFQIDPETTHDIKFRATPSSAIQSSEHDDPARP
jgi:hypothetical protein